MRKFLCGRLREYGRACRLNLKDTGWGMKLVVLVITGFFCGALASEYFGTKLIFFAGGVFLGDMLLMVAVCLLSRFGDRIWHRNIGNILYGIVGFLIFVCCCVYGSVGNEHMVSTFFFYIPLYFIAVSGKIYLGMAGKTAAYTDWRNPFCTRLCYMVCVSGIFVWTGIFG